MIDATVGVPAPASTSARPHPASASPPSGVPASSVDTTRQNIIEQAALGCDASNVSTPLPDFTVTRVVLGRGSPSLACSVTTNAGFA